MEGVHFFNLLEMPNLLGLSEIENLENGKQIVRTMHSIVSICHSLAGLHFISHI